MRQDFKQNVYARKGKDGRDTCLNERAEAMATYLEDVHWGKQIGEADPETGGSGGSPLSKHVGKIIGDHLEHCTIKAHQSETMDRLFETRELNECLQRLKRDKSPGPDSITTDFVKDLNEANRSQLLDMVNSWWVQGRLHKTMEEARVAALYKKGDPENLENYRPLSLLDTFFKVMAAMMKARIEQHVEQQLGNTQFGFRRGKGTTQAIYVARRVQEFMERGGLDAQFVFLDWEKAFDKISHEWLMKAIASYGLSKRMVEMIMQIYENPRFHVEVEGVKSEWKRQRRGIRQGCPLSPYLFIMVMNRVIEEVNLLKNLVTRVTKGSVFEQVEMEGLDATELLFADDTMIMARNTHSIEGLLWTIEMVSGEYGLKLNKGKCVEICNKDGQRRVHFETGEELTRSRAVDYLGTRISTEVDPAREINRRIVSARVAEEKLRTFWREGRLSRRWRLIIYQSVVVTTLIYGLEVLPLNETWGKKLDAFYVRGLRRIMGMPSTYIDRAASNKNDAVLEKVAAELNAATGGRQKKKAVNMKDMMPSEKIKNKAVKILEEVICMNAADIRKRVTMDTAGLNFNLPDKMRVGRPRTSWILETARAAWEQWGLKGKEWPLEEVDKSVVVRKLGEAARARMENRKRRADSR